jgi:DNA-binding MarR family transcriptional regulator
MVLMPAGHRAAATRRDLGPVAWCVLECLLERSDDGLTSTASVRAIAADLGVAKNTAHRAIARLVRAGVADPVQERDPRGRFRPGRYRLNLTDLSVAPTLTPRSPRPRSRPRVAPAQLSLLEPS